MHADPATPERLRIVHYPAEVLREKAAPVERVDETVRSVALRMIQLMHEAPGIGLAAPQVGLPWRMFVCHVPPFEDDGPEDATDPPSRHEHPIVCINPVLSDFSRDLVPYEEGCLSLPEILGNVRRPTVCTIEALDIDGNPFSMRAQGLLARCWQHEYDHLEGVLIIDRMDPAGKMRNKRAVQDLEAGARLH
ncbi:MAG: hypothetical protein Tsb0013_15810 [Phycisphaerales bacterium]